MSLKAQLILRIAFASLLCGTIVSAYVLWLGTREVQQRAETAADRMARQLNVQLMRIATATDLPERFPDWTIFEPSRLAGLCIRLHDRSDKVITSRCVGTDAQTLEIPRSFQLLYRWLFRMSQDVKRSLSLNSKPYGTIVVSPLAEQQMAEAWQTLTKLVGLTVVILSGVSLMTYFSLLRLLRPAERMASELAIMQQGNLDHRLSGGGIEEFERISSMVNRLAEQLEHSLAARAALNRKLLVAHEEERTWLARELHDEFGQCLAGINALAASIRYSAEREAPGLVREAEQIESTVEQVMDLMRNVLSRLRPPELDALGLKECLRRLVQHWNDRCHDRTEFDFESPGDWNSLPAELTGHVYRIVQECLNNIARHAVASRAWVNIEVERLGKPLSEMSEIKITISDNGCTMSPIAPERFGIGLRGIHERAMALGGRCTLNVCKPSGLSVHVCLPWTLKTSITDHGT